MTDGASLSEVSQAALQSLNGLLQEKEALRQDLADGGEKHQWEWPTTIRKDVYNKIYLIGARDGLADVRAFAKSEFEGLMWFCNRASSARMPRLKPSNDLIRRVEEGSMRGSIREILAEARTKEEADAILRYMMKVGLAR